MQKPSWLFWLVAALGTLWGAMGVIDFILTRMHNEAYLKSFDPALIAWIAEFPTWRVVLWGIAVGTSFLGPALLLLRQRLAAMMLLTAAAATIVGFVYDMALGGGGAHYHGGTLLILAMIVAFSVFLAWYGRKAASKGYLT